MAVRGWWASSDLFSVFPGGMWMDLIGVNCDRGLILMRGSIMIKFAVMTCFDLMLLLVAYNTDLKSNEAHR